jgi:hypothetical protein
MIKTFMLLLAFTVTDPSGIDRDEKVHVLSRHFDSEKECVNFIESWEDAIRSRGVETVQSMLAEGWQIRLDHIGCAEKPENA